MGMQELLRNMDRGFYKDAAGQKRGAVGHFSALAQKAGIAPEGADWERREKVYFRRFGIREPDEYGVRADAIRAYAWEGYALEKAFQDLGMPLRGRNAPTVEKVFATTTSQNLFPIYFESQAVAGILATSLVPQLVAMEEQINSHTADHLTMSDSAGDRTTSKTGEGATLPAVEVKTTDQGVKLSKFGAQLLTTYEAVRLVRLPVVAIFFQRLGAQIGIDETDELLEVLVAGDGNSGSPVVDTDAEVSGTLDYDELVRLKLAFSLGYDMRQAVINDTYIRTILNMAEFKDPLTGFNYQRTGQLIDPMGASWHRWTSTGSSSFSTDRIVAVDDRYAAVQYTEGGVMTESDRIIDRQWDRSTISKWTGFGKLDYNATQCLDIIP